MSSASLNANSKVTILKINQLSKTVQVMFDGKKYTLFEGDSVELTAKLNWNDG